MELLVTAGRDGKDRGFTDGAYEYMQSSPGSANGFFITEGAYEYMQRGFIKGAYEYMQLRQSRLLKLLAASDATKSCMIADRHLAGLSPGFDGLSC